MSINEKSPTISDDPATNPFAAPTMDAPAVERDENDVRWLSFGWPIAIACQLPVPLFFGWSVSGEGLPRLGMLFGILLVYFCGKRLRSSRPWMMKRLTIGAYATCVSQFWPVGQMMIGIVATGFARALFNYPIFGYFGASSSPSELATVPAVLCATVLTGIGLIVPSLIVGIVVVYLFGSRRSSPGRE